MVSIPCVCVATDPATICSISGGGGGGFWDEVASQKSSLAKPSTITKSLSSGAVSAQMKPKQKPKPKKEEQQVLKVFSSASAQDDFTEWCIKALADINSSVDGECPYFFLIMASLNTFSCFFLLLFLFLCSLLSSFQSHRSWRKDNIIGSGQVRFFFQHLIK